MKIGERLSQPLSSFCLPPIGLRLPRESLITGAFFEIFETESNDKRFNPIAALWLRK